MFALIIGLFLVGLLLNRQTSETSAKSLKLAVMVLAASALVTQLGFILWAPHYHWNQVRILPVELFVRGYPLYTEDSTGPANGNLYGPFAHWFYLPVTFFADADVKVMIGSALTALILWVPAFMMLGEAFPSSNESRLNRWLGFSIFLLFTQIVEPLRMVSRSIHADAPAIGFATLALLFTFRYIRTEARGFLVASCAMAAIAVWSKQNAVVIVPLLPLLIWRFRGRSAGLKAGVTMLVVGMIVSALTVLLCRQFMAIYLNLWVIPGKHTWYSNFYSDEFPRLFAFLGTSGKRLQILTEAFVQLVVEFKLILGAGFLAGIFGWSLNRSNQVAFPKNQLIAIMAVGCFMLPMGLLGRVKVGGYLNSFGFPMYFLTLAIAIMIVLVLQAAIKKIRWPQGSWFSLILVTALAVGGGWFVNKRLNRALQWASLPEWGETEAIVHIKRLGGAAYFPWHPVAHLLAENKAYHFQYAVYDRDLAARPMSQAHYASGIPEKITSFVVPDHAWRKPYTDRTLTNRFNILGEPDRVTLPGWLIYPVQLRKEEDVSMENLIKSARQE